LNEKGAGGLETAYIQLAEAFAKKKCTVFVFAKCEQSHVYNNVYWIPFQEFEVYCQQLVPDFLITSRWFDAMYQENLMTTKKIVWLHDAHFADPNKPDAFTIADQVVCSSAWHRDYIAERYGEGILASKIKIIPLSVDKSAFIEAAPKNPKQVIYSSNPDRGLLVLLSMWPEIRKESPDLHLVVTYGWEGLETWGNDAAWLDQVRQTRDAALSMAANAGNVVFTGRLKKADLYKAIKDSILCLYPNSFPETFCLTSLETQLAGTPMITSNFGALATTADPNCTILIDGNPNGEFYRERFLKETNMLLQDRDRLNRMGLQCRLSAQHRFLGWDGIAEQWLENMWKL
jgi:glycosyltransferase involved in cell wall biosynthesis